MTILLGLLRAVPLAAWAIAAALAWGSWQHHRATVAGQALRNLQADAAQATVGALTRQIATQQEVIHAAQQTALADRAGAADAAGALRRLRERATGAGCPAIATPAPGSASAANTGTVPAELFQRLGEAAGQLAAIADERGRAGAACEAMAR